MVPVIQDFTKLFDLQIIKNLKNISGASINSSGFEFVLSYDLESTF